MKQYSNPVVFIPTYKEGGSIFNGATCYCKPPFNYLGVPGGIKICISGFGKTNTAITLSRYLSIYPDTTPILMGIAGAYRSSGLKPGDICSVVTDIFADEALLIENGKPSLKLSYEFGFDIGTRNRVDFDVLPLGYDKVISNTVSLLAGSDWHSDLYSSTGAFVENMEGASFGLTSASFSKRAYQIRAVSNYCGHKNFQEWDIKKASKSMFEAYKDLCNLFGYKLLD